MKLVTASMFVASALASSKTTMLRKPHTLETATGARNYFGIAHIDFAGKPPAFYRWTNGTETTNANYTLNTTIGYTSSNVNGWVSTSLQIRAADNDFYFDLPSTIQNKAPNQLYFSFATDSAGTDKTEIKLNQATAAGPASCATVNAGKLYEDKDTTTRSTPLKTTLGVDDTGTELDYVCWPTAANTYLDSADAVKTATTTPCGGRSIMSSGSAFERYIVVELGRTHDNQCDFLTACTAPTSGVLTNTSSLTGNFQNFGLRCSSSLNTESYPDNTCNTCTACTNPCNATAEEYFVKTATGHLCGEARKNADTTPNVANVKDAATCIVAATCSDVTHYESTAYGPTQNRVCTACPATESCDGSATRVNCPVASSDTGDDKYNSGSSNGCVQSTADKQALSTRNGTKACAAGEYAPPNRRCRATSAGNESNAIGGQKDCLDGWISAAGAVCSKCPAGTYQKDADKTQCVTCGTTKYSGAGATFCSQCPPRYISKIEKDISGNNVTMCEQCDPGEVVKSNVCTQVVARTYQIADSDVEQNCAAGNETQNAAGTAVVTGATQCIACDADSYDDDDDAATACIDIPLDRQKNGTTGKPFNCPAGKESATGLNGCTSCAKGSSSTAGNSCMTCTTGKFAAAIGAVACDVPKAGYYADSNSSQAYCTNSAFPNNNRDDCTNRTTTLNDPTTGADNTMVRIKYSLTGDHTERLRVRCGTDRTITGEIEAKGADNDAGRDAAVLITGAVGYCKCTKPYGGLTTVETDDTSGCANAAGQCVGALSCANKCSRADRDAAQNCETVFATTIISGTATCVAYHGDIPTKKEQTWIPASGSCSTAQASLGTLL